MARGTRAIIGCRARPPGPNRGGWRRPYGVSEPPGQGLPEARAKRDRHTLTPPARGQRVRSEYLKRASDLDVRTRYYRRSDLGAVSVVDSGRNVAVIAAMQVGRCLSGSIRPSTGDRVIDYQHDDRSNHRHHHTVYVEAGDPARAHGCEDEAPYDLPDYSKYDVEEEAFAGFVHDFAGDETGD